MRLRLLPLLAAQRAGLDRLRALGLRLCAASCSPFLDFVLAASAARGAPSWFRRRGFRPPPDRPPSRRSFPDRWCSAGAGSRRPDRSSPAPAGSCGRPNNSTRRSWRHPAGRPAPSARAGRSTRAATRAPKNDRPNRHQPISPRIPAPTLAHSRTNCGVSWGRPASYLSMTENRRRPDCSSRIRRTGSPSGSSVRIVQRQAREPAT